MSIVKIFYTRPEFQEKAQLAELTGEYPTFPYDFEEVYSYETRMNAPPNVICQKSIDLMNSIYSKKLKIRKMTVGDICNIGSKYFRVNTYGLMNISKECTPVCSENNPRCSA